MHTRDVDIPHFQLPFVLDPDGVRVTEQDSLDEVTDCVQAVLRTTLGERIELPDFGRPDQAFRQNGADLEQLRDAVDTWEPRATVEIDHDPAFLSGQVDRVTVNSKGG